MRRFTLLSVLLIQGCSGVVTMDGIQGNDVSEIGIYAVDSSQRVIMADMDNGRFCAEPPPETQMESESSFRMLLEAAINSEEDAGKIEAYRALSEKAKQLYRRSHAVQMYRDASYYLCQSYVNGALSISSEKIKDIQSVFSVDKQKYKELLKEQNSSLKNLEIEKRNLVSKLNSVQGNGDTELNAQLSDKEKEIERLRKEILELELELRAAEFMVRFTELFSDDIYMVSQMMLAQRAFRSLDGEISEFYESELSREKGKNEALSSGVDSLDKKYQSITEQLNKIQVSVDDNSERINTLESGEGSKGNDNGGEAGS